MSNKTIQLDEALHSYFLQTSLREPEILARLRKETSKLPDSNMQISPEQGQFMGLLVELMGVRNALEIGTFTGYSALSVALALPKDGRLVACDVSRQWTDIGRRYWEEAGVADRIDLRIGPAIETLDALLESGSGESFDFAFIDADKTGYRDYYERCLQLIRPGGLIAVDNTLWHGKISDASVTDPDTEAIRSLLLHVRDDVRVTSSHVPIGDGLLLARKRVS